VLYDIAGHRSTSGEAFKKIGKEAGGTGRKKSKVLPITFLLLRAVLKGFFCVLTTAWRTQFSTLEVFLVPVAFLTSALTYGCRSLRRAVGQCGVRIRSQIRTRRGGSACGTDPEPVVIFRPRFRSWVAPR
jgi:hypothetical protein